MKIGIDAFLDWAPSAPPSSHFGLAGGPAQLAVFFRTAIGPAVAAGVARPMKFRVDWGVIAFQLLEDDFCGVAFGAGGSIIRFFFGSPLLLAFWSVGVGQGSHSEWAIFRG